MNTYNDITVLRAMESIKHGYDVVCDGDTKTFKYETICNRCGGEVSSDKPNYYCDECRGVNKNV